jgi:uncharacterized protein
MHSAFWRRLDIPGHDAARIEPDGDGWRLAGTALFRGDGRSVTAAYEVSLGANWIVRRGAVYGHIDSQPFGHEIVRGPGGWRLDGRAVGLADIVDLDFGFTPATNLPQLRRVNLAIGEAAEFNVAWFDIGEDKLIPLLQRYRRIADRRYAYESPQGPYSATLEVAESGFVSVYPGLWAIEA